MTPLLCFQDRYCIISSLDSHIYREHGRQGAGGGGGVTEKCYYCHAADPELSHNVTNIIHRYHGNTCYISHDGTSCLHYINTGGSPL